MFYPIYEEQDCSIYSFFFFPLQTTFKAPLGTDAVVVDLQGLGKGEAWVNGQSLGRYWPSSIAEDGCNATCDYRGPYTNTKCVRNCGNPTQRWWDLLSIQRSIIFFNLVILLFCCEFSGTMFPGPSWPQMRTHWSCLKNLVATRLWWTSKLSRLELHAETHMRTMCWNLPAKIDQFQILSLLALVIHRAAVDHLAKAPARGTRMRWTS